MAAYDIGVVVVVFVFGVIGYIRGFTWEAGFLCGVMLGLASAFRLTGIFAALFLKNLSPPVAEIVGFFAVFLMTFIVVLGVTYLARRLVERAKLEKADRWAGSVLGVLQGVGVCFVVTLALLKFGNEPLRVYVGRTYAARLSTAGAKLLQHAVPTSKDILPLNLPSRIRRP